MNQRAIALEVQRLRKLPKAGVFTLLHHRGPLLEPSIDVMKHVVFILENKPKNEVLVRLRHIRHVELKLLPKNCQKAYVESREVHAKWLKAYHEWGEADAKWRKSAAGCQKSEANWESSYDKWRRADVKGRMNYIECQKVLDGFRGALALVLKHVPRCKWNGTCIDGTEGSV